METRYDLLNNFFYLERNEPLPKGFEILTAGQFETYAEHRNIIEAKKDLRSFARQCGANALLNIHTIHIENYYAYQSYYECRGVPAVIARRTPRGKYTKEQLIRSFYVHSQPPSRMMQAYEDWLELHTAGIIRRKKFERFYRFYLVLCPLLLFLAAIDIKLSKGGDAATAWFGFGFFYEQLVKLFN